MQGSFACAQWQPAGRAARSRKCGELRATTPAILFIVASSSRGSTPSAAMTVRTNGSDSASVSVSSRQGLFIARSCFRTRVRDRCAVARSAVMQLAFMSAPLFWFAARIRPGNQAGNHGASLIGRRRPPPLAGFCRHCRQIAQTWLRPSSKKMWKRLAPLDRARRTASGLFDAQRDVRDRQSTRRDGHSRTVTA